MGNFGKLAELFPSREKTSPSERNKHWIGRVERGAERLNAERHVKGLVLIDLFPSS